MGSEMCIRDSSESVPNEVPSLAVILELVDEYDQSKPPDIEMSATATFAVRVAAAASAVVPKSNFLIIISLKIVKIYLKSGTSLVR